MVQLSDRVKTTSTTAGNGPITLSSSPVSGYQAVPSTLDGMTVGYVIESGSGWEIGHGIYTHSSLGLTRNLRSSSTGSLLDLSNSNSPHTVFLSPAFEDIKAPTITVTVSGGNFLIDGTANQTINLVPSVKYVFDVTSVGASHPFRFATQADGASSSQYTTGITVYNDASSVQKHIEVQLEQDAPSTLYYYCTSHSGMGGTVNVGGSYTHPNHSGEVTSSGDGATVIADNVVDEANLKVSNTPTDGYVLTARSGNTGGMTWEAASGGGGGSSSPYSSTIFTVGSSSEYNASSKVLTTNYTATRVAVYLNGVKLLLGTDCTATNGTSIDLTNAAPVTGDKIEVVEHGDAAAGSGVTSYANKAAIDAVSSPAEGSLAFDEDKNVLYIRAGSAWERVQHGSNVGPRFTTTPASSLTLSSGSTSTITSVAVDEAGFPVTYDWDAFSGSTVYNASSLPNQITNVSESSGVFTLTPTTNTSNGGSFTFRTKASDGAQVALATTLVSLSFSEDITTPNSSPFASGGTNSFDYNGGATADSGGGFSSTLKTGKIYIEFVMGSGTSVSSQAVIGLIDSTASSGGYNTSGFIGLSGYAGAKVPGLVNISLEAFDQQGDIAMIAYDTSTREIWLGVNGNWYENPSTSSSYTVGTSSTSSFKLLFSGTTNSGGSYNGTIITAGSGTFTYTIPSGFSGH